MKKGDIYYISKRNDSFYNSRSIAPGRPGIIISTEAVNAVNMTVMVVYLTTKPKTNSPEHFTIECNGRTSTAICEQITTVDKSQIGEYIGKLSSSDMLKLNQSLMHTFDISTPAERENNDDIVKRYEAQLKIYRDLLKEELSK